MPGPYFTASGVPVTLSRGRSGPPRSEFAAIGTAFDGVWADMQLKAPIASPVFTGTPSAPTIEITGAIPAGDATNRVATTAFVASVALTSALPGQTGKDGNVIKTRAGLAFWNKGELEIVRVAGTSVTAEHGKHYILLNAAKTTVTAMASPADDDQFRVSPANGRLDNEIAWSGNKHQNISDATMAITDPSVLATFVNATFGFKVTP